MNGQPVRSYSTRFEADEDPISEGGMWLNGQTDGIDWVDCMTQNGGEVCGEVSRMTVAERRAEQVHDEATGGEELTAGDYDDPAAVLTGEWGPNQHGKATVFCRNPTERVLPGGRDPPAQRDRRPTAAPATRCSSGRSRPTRGYAEIVRWNGPIGDFTSLAAQGRRRVRREGRRRRRGDRSRATC